MPPRPLDLARHPYALPAWILGLALICLLPAIGTPGLWEPQEMSVADEAAARADKTYQAPVAASTTCKSKQQADSPRSLTPRAAAWGLHFFASSDGGARLPFALLGIVGMLAVFGTAWRLGSPRAGFFAGLVLCSFPMWALESRMLTSEIGVATGATLMAYGMAALSRPITKRIELLALDLLGACVALGAGAWLAWHGGGVLLGLIPPLAAFAIAGAFGAPLAVDALATVWAQIDRRPVRPDEPRWVNAANAAVSLAAGAAAIGLGIWLVYQIFDLGPLTVGTRQVFGKSILTSDCYSSALGGVWRQDDDLRATYDSLFEQAGFGMFPWAVIVPVALSALAIGACGDRRRHAGAVVLGWAAAAWLCAAVFNRKVGFALYPGFPACAIGVGIWLDAVLERRDELARDNADRTGWATTPWVLIGLVMTAGVIVMSKDLSAFPERLTSLLVGNDQIKYPVNARFLFLPMKVWLWVIGLGVALPLTLSAWLWRPTRTQLSPLATPALVVGLVFTALAGLYWTHGWHRGLSSNLSSKQVFQVYRDQRKAGEPLAIMGSMGNAPRYYAGGKTETIAGRDQLLEYLARPTRVFALVPASELCPIHSARTEQGGYFVLDDTNARYMLFSNQLGKLRDKNPLATAMTRTPPAWLAKAGEKNLGTWDNQVQLVGMRIPKKVVRGEKFTMTLVFKVIAPIGGGWKVFVHIDGGGSRIIGDHDPLRGRCATNFWKVGDYVVDTFEVDAGNASFPTQNYDIWVGFFTGSNPNWRNMTVTGAPDGQKDNNNRVKVGQVRLVSSRGGCCSAGDDDATGAIGAGLLALFVMLGVQRGLRRPRRRFPA
ncbi:MAG TPA: hypothetical protein VM261_05890 [Kofleriaceae bacterium]|nr:hypothetical protein [Kofleriaceae bacterium]